MQEETLIQIQELIESAESSLKTAHSMLRNITGIHDSGYEKHITKAGSLDKTGSDVEGKIIEGIFDGQNMVDSDAQNYPVPANYASKSKLVEGDGMKLTITDEGKFIYKQISPIPRRTTVGTLIQDDGQYKVLCEGKTYRVLLASVTFYRAEVGDQVTILLPEDGEAQWGAVEAVLPKHMAEAVAKKTLTKSLKSEDGELSPEMGIDDE